MEKVKLLDGLFKTSQDKGKEYLLYLDVDRLLAPCYEAIGKDAKKPRYGGWEARAISGHSLGHFLSAAAAMYVATVDEKVKEKLDYAVSELAYLQSQEEEGYVSGFPRDCFDRVFSGDFTVSRFELGGSWVPWYSIHKIFAGLIDAYELTGNKQALEVVIKLSDWAKRGTDKLTEEQFDRMLFCEHGGMCEAMSKLYKITGNKDYLELSKRFYHKETLIPLSIEKDELEGKHANTQIPKVIGAARLYDFLGEEDYKTAATFFWDRVTKSRSYVIGGNSRDEHFGKSDTEKLGVTTAETCNTYNMLKLTECLYNWCHDSKYMDYYENALYNHILASQDPESGMKMYFVSTQPGHFKIYCSPDNSFWCCTGTGMENPARYIRQIYYRDKNELYVNLYISSEINLEDKGIILRQETSFPESSVTRFMFDEAAGENMSLKIRVPYWVAGEVTAVVNGKDKHSSAEEVTTIVSGKEKSSCVEQGYITIDRVWNKGDVVEVTLPMELHVYASKEDSKKIAFMYGPIVLAGALGRENFPETDILEDHLKLNNYPGIQVPDLVTDEDDIRNCVRVVENKTLTFETDAIGKPGNVKVTLIPFYALHHERYTIYWKNMTGEEYRLSELTSPDYQESLDKITIDSVNPNEQQPEVEHKFKSLNSTSDYLSAAGKGFREVINEGYFSYEMAVDQNKETSLVVTYWGSDRDSWMEGKTFIRSFDITIDGTVIATERINENKPYSLFDVFYSIPEELTKGKSKVEVKFSCEDGKIAGRVFGVRTVFNKNGHFSS